jgi:hypothetical protein
MGRRNRTGVSLPRTWPGRRHLRDPESFVPCKKESYQTFTYSISAKSYCRLCAAIRVTRPEQRTSLSRSSVQSSCQTCLWALQKHAADTSDQAGALNNRLASTTAAIGRRKRQPPGMLNNHRGQWWRPAILFRAFSMFLGTGAWAFRLTRQAAASRPSQGRIATQGYCSHKVFYDILGTLEMLLGVC